MAEQNGFTTITALTLRTLISRYLSDVVPLGLDGSVECAQAQRDIAAQFLQLFDQSGDQALYSHHRGGHITVSGWLSDSSGRYAAMCHHKKIQLWIPMGGHFEPEIDASLSAACLRECLEESGIDEPLMTVMSLGGGRSIGGLKRNKGTEGDQPEDLLPFDLDIHNIPASGGMPAHQHYDVRYLVRCAGKPELRLCDEAHDVRWIALTELPQYTSEASTLRQVGKVRAFRELFDSW